MKKLYYLASLALLCGCTTKTPQPEHKMIAPLPAAITVDNLQDCTVPVAFKADDFHWEEGRLTMTVYNMDLYDAVEISQMQAGDTIFYAGESMVINTIVEDHGGIDINGGIEEGGCCLAGHEGGTYVARNCDDHATYTKLGQVELPLAEDFLIIDCGMFPEDPSDTIRTNHDQYIANLDEGKLDFFQLNTRVTIEHGVITQINRHWIP